MLSGIRNSLYSNPAHGIGNHTEIFCGFSSVPSVKYEITHFWIVAPAYTSKVGAAVFF
jgi:hypothetical protein